MTWIEEAARAEFTRLAPQSPAGGLRRQLNADHLARQRRFFAAPKVEVAVPAPIPIPVPISIHTPVQVETAPEPVALPPEPNASGNHKSKLDIFCETLVARVAIERRKELGLTCNVEDIQRAVAAHYGTTRLDIISDRRTADAVLPRHVAMYLASKHTTRSIADIGRRTGGRDHTTVLHAIRRITERIAADPEFAAQVEAMSAELEQ